MEIMKLISHPTAGDVWGSPLHRGQSALSSAAVKSGLREAAVAERWLREGDGGAAVTRKRAAVLKISLTFMAGESSGKAHLVTLMTNALEIANSWVNETSGATLEQSSEVSGEEFEGRPLRMGLGSKVSRFVEIAASDDPVERKLMGKLGVGKRPRPIKPMGSLIASQRPSQAPSKPGSIDSDEDESESRATSFVKKSKAAVPLMPTLPKKKK